MDFPFLAAPLALRHRRLNNRLVFGAHTAHMAEDGRPGARYLAYLEERAKGGAGMIVAEPLPVHRTAVLTPGNFRNDDAIVPAFRTLTGRCRRHGAVMIIQLYHVGQHGDWGASFEANWSPSGLPSHHDSSGSHAMRESEIEEVIEGFADAAARAQAGGFDGVELFATYHGLIEQFWTPWSNRRTDRWGGSFAKRMRFSGEILRRIRARCGEDFIVGMAISHTPDVPVMLSIRDLQRIVAHHDASGALDYVSCGTGSYLAWHQMSPISLFPPMPGRAFAAAIRRAVRHAKVQVESHVRTPRNAEAILAAGEADLVSVVRGQIADPHMGAKALSGHAAAVRPCISCNEMCRGRRFRERWISCLVNPSAGREHVWGGEPPAPARAPRQVLVVGGGPAGLEAARVAAARGHRVTLVEREAELGGQYRLAARQPGRAQLGEHLAWYEAQLASLQADVRRAECWDADRVRRLGAEAVVVATGARAARTGFQRAMPSRASLPGADAASVMSVQDVLAGTGRPGAHVLVLDDLDGWEGAGTALLLAEAGHRVTLATAAPVVAKELAPSGADGTLRRRLAAGGGEMLTEVAVLAWTGAGARLLSLLDGREWERPFDTLVLACAPVAETGLADALREGDCEVHLVGDAVAPRRAAAAFYEGRRVGLAL